MRSNPLRISTKYRKMAEIYKRFSLIKRCEGASADLIKMWDDYDPDRDFSEEALQEAFQKESFGTGFDIRRSTGKINGYIEGKQWMDLTITEYWLPDITNPETPFYAWELYLEFPKWFLDKILPKRYHLTEEEIKEFKDKYA